MRAAVLTRYGDVDALELRNIDEPQTGPGELNALTAKLPAAPKDWFRSRPSPA
jgi:NADPH:quinone reductase-like Zn-dependent oxidoreductase